MNQNMKILLRDENCENRFIKYRIAQRMKKLIVGVDGLTSQHLGNSAI